MIKKIRYKILRIGRYLKGYILNLRFPTIHRSIVIRSPLFFTNKQYFYIGKNVYIGPHARLEAVTSYAGEVFSPEIIIQDGTKIQQNFHLTCAKKIFIGKDCAITHNVTITDIDHFYEVSNNDFTPPIANKLLIKELTIGERCMIFPNSVILGGTQLGDNCVVAANSVVRGVFPEYSLIGGSPARILKQLNPLTGKWEKYNNDSMKK